MTSRDIIFSTVLHAVVIAVAVVSVPLAKRGQFPHEEIIRVNLAAMPKGAVQPKAIAAPPQEQAVEEAPATKPKPKEEPIEEKKKPEKKKPAEEKPKPAVEEQPAQAPAPDEESTGKAGEAGGSDEVKAPVGAGSPFGGATMDNANFDYPYWFTQAFNKIATNFHNRVQYPGPLVCVVYFQVIRSGRVIDMSIKESSGVPEFDDGCLTAVSKSTPFPPLPRDFVDEILGISLPFKYEP